MASYIAEEYAYFVKLLSFKSVKVSEIFRNFNEKEYVALRQRYRNFGRSALSDTNSI